MLGKRPRALQRTASKMLLIPDENLPSSPAAEEKPKVSTPAFGVARQVIGFNPVNKDIDAVGSPRSVLINVGSGCSQTRSPRSPRSGLEGLISTPRPWEKKGSDGVGLGIVGALSTAEDPELPKLDAPKTLIIPFQCPTSSTCQHPRSPSLSKPIPIGQTQSPSTSRGNGDRQPWCSPVHVLEESLTGNSQGLRSHINKQEQLSVYSTSADMEMEVRQSIFSAASPASASSCSDHSGLLLEIDFLNTCYFCKRQLYPGKDVYMYRGDRAFCSVECRYQQIVIDERKEKYSASPLNSGNSAASSSVKHGGRGLTTTTAAAA
eukprot:c28165_g1_i1 orf=534-1493(+)